MYANTGLAVGYASLQLNATLTDAALNARNATERNSTCRRLTQRYDLSRSPMWGWCGLDPTSPRICGRRGIGRERKSQLNAGLRLRMVQRGFVGAFLRSQKFSLFHPFLHHRTQNAVCQGAQLLPTGIALVLHITLHSLLTLKLLYALRRFLPSSAWISDSLQIVTQMRQSTDEARRACGLFHLDAKKTQSTGKPDWARDVRSRSISRCKSGMIASRTFFTSSIDCLAPSMAVPCPIAYCRATTSAAA
jgi:hypothetical protein